MSGATLTTAEPSPTAVRLRRLTILLVVCAALSAGAGARFLPAVGLTAEAGTATPAPVIDSTVARPAPASPELMALTAFVAVDEPVAPTPPRIEPTPTARRYVDLPTTRLRDTRQDGGAPLDPGGLLTIGVPDSVPPSADTLVVSVTLAGAAGPGPVTVDAGGATVTAIQAAGPGAMMTNLAFVAHRTGEPLTVATVGGGHLVVDLVGYFEPATEATAGRLVAVPAQRLVRLVTEIDGREAVVSPLANPTLPASGVASVVVRITADVGPDGGMVRLGADDTSLTNMMMWAPTAADDRTRQGVAIVPLSELDELALAYNGGAVLDLDVLGYVTDEAAQPATTGLFVATPDAAARPVSVTAGVATTVDIADHLGVPADSIDAVIVTATAMGSAPGGVSVESPGGPTPASPTVEVGGGMARTGFTIVEPAADGTIVVTGEVDAEVTLAIAGYTQP